MITLLLPAIFMFQSLQTFQVVGKVTAVLDGNTIEVTARDGQRYIIVLMGIDCPELEQEFGSAAKEFVESLVYGKQVVVDVHGKDRFKNYVGVVLLDNNTDVRIALLEEGLAWTAEKNPSRELEALRAAAVAERRGLWNQEDPTPPWLFRRQQSMREAKSR